MKPEYSLSSKYCRHCNGRVIQDTDCKDSFICCEYGREDWYDIHDIDRYKIMAYLKKSGWEMQFVDKYLTPPRVVQSWTKKGYDYLLSLDWLDRLGYSEVLYIEEGQIQRAVYRIADSEKIGFGEAADKIREVGDD